MRDAELRAEQARTNAILSDAAGDHERAAVLRDEAEHLAAVARGTSAVSDARADWAAETALTRELAERAEHELRTRGLAPADESDRIDADTWLAEQRFAVEAEDAHRPVTELGVPLVDEHPVEKHPLGEHLIDEQVAERPARAQPVHAERPVLEDEVELRTSSPAHEIAPVDPDDLELAALVHTAAEAEDRIADRESQEAAHDALDAEVGIAPEHDIEPVDLGDAIELSTPSDLGGVLRRWPDDE